MAQNASERTNALEECKAELAVARQILTTDLEAHHAESNMQATQAAENIATLRTQRDEHTQRADEHTQRAADEQAKATELDKQHSMAMADEINRAERAKLFAPPSQQRERDICNKIATLEAAITSARVAAKRKTIVADMAAAEEAHAQQMKKLKSELLACGDVPSVRVHVKTCGTPGCTFADFHNGAHSMDAPAAAKGAVQGGGGRKPGGLVTVKENKSLQKFASSMKHVRDCREAKTAAESNHAAMKTAKQELDRAAMSLKSDTPKAVHTLIVWGMQCTNQGRGLDDVIADMHSHFRNVARNNAVLNAAAYLKAASSQDPQQLTTKIVQAAALLARTVSEYKTRLGVDDTDDIATALPPSQQEQTLAKLSSIPLVESCMPGDWTTPGDDESSYVVWHTIWNESGRPVYGCIDSSFNHAWMKESEVTLTHGMPF
jgi:hypothetical protein